MAIQPVNTVTAFVKALAAGVVVLAFIILRLWRPGMGGVLADTTKGDRITLVAILGGLLVLITLALTLK